MTISEIPSNFTPINTTEFYNSLTGTSMNVTKGVTSDLSVISHLCTDYHFMILFITSIVLILFFCKATANRFAKKKPDNEALQNIKNIITETVDMMLIFVTVIMWFIALRGYLG